MSFLVRKAQVRPTISWPMERPVESQREPIPLRSTLTSTTPSSPRSFKSSHTSNHSISTAATATSIPNSLQCEFDQDAYFAEFPDSIDISDDFPDNEAVAEAGEVLIYDSDGNERPFKSIYSGDPIGEQQLVIFVRHFFCGVSTLFFLLVHLQTVNNCSQGLSSISTSPLQSYHSADLFYLTSPDLHYHHWSRLAEPHPILPAH